MRDAFGVERPDLYEVEKAFSLRPVGDFIKGAANALRSAPKAPMGPATRATTAGANMAGGARRSIGNVIANRSTIASGMKTSAQNKIQAHPKIAGATAIGGTAAVAGGAGYAAGKPDWMKS